MQLASIALNEVSERQEAGERLQCARGHKDEKSGDYFAL